MKAGDEPTPRMNFTRMEAWVGNDFATRVIPRRSNHLPVFVQLWSTVEGTLSIDELANHEHASA